MALATEYQWEVGQILTTTRTLTNRDGGTIEAGAVVQILQRRHGYRIVALSPETAQKMQGLTVENTFRELTLHEWRLIVGNNDGYENIRAHLIENSYEMAKANAKANGISIEEEK